MKKTIGILGGGQLAQMLTESALSKNLTVAIFAQSINEPACSLAHHVLIAPQSDTEKLKKFFSFCDLVILESEFYSSELLKEISEQTNVKVYPELEGYSQLSSKEKQKDFFKKCKVPTVGSRLFKNKLDITRNDFNFPLMLKKSIGSYDGYGNLIVQNQNELEEKIESFSENFKTTIIAEDFIKIKNEYACMLVKGKESSIFLPPVKTIQEQSICKLVEYPAKLNSYQSEMLNNYMIRIDENILGTGVYAFEFFENELGDLFVNEAAPRVHNSYHFSIEGFDKSQFDLMIDVALGEKLNPIKENFKYLTMLNLLGQTQGSNYHLEFPNIEENIDFKIHLYGKTESKIGRKLGHLTMYSDYEHSNIANKIKNEYRL